MTEKNIKLWFIEPKNEEEFNEIVAHDPDESQELYYEEGVVLWDDRHEVFDLYKRHDIPSDYFEITIEEFREMYGKKGEVVEEEVETNPKKQYGLVSLPLHLWSPLASAYGSLALYNGGMKYGRNNFKATPVEASIYIAAAMRHLVAWSEGEEFDPADGVPNLGGVLANIAILLEARAAGTLVDDRQMGTGYLKEREALKQIMANVTKVHEGKNPRHYTIKDNK